MAQPEVVDRGAEMTRSLLGWGVVAGPFYVVVGLVLALTRPGFDLSRHALSLLTLGDLGWLQSGNLIITGLMVLAAATGVLRAIPSSRGRAFGLLIAVGGIAVILSAFLLPFPARDFPPGGKSVDIYELTVETTFLKHVVASSDIPHSLVVAIGFVAIAAAAVAHGGWCRSIEQPRSATLSYVLGAILIVSFVGGARSPDPAALALLGVALVAQFGWLSFASVQVSRWSRDPQYAMRIGF